MKGAKMKSCFIISVVEYLGRQGTSLLVFLYEQDTILTQFGFRSLATRILQVSFWVWIIMIFAAYIANFAANRVIDLVQDHDAGDDDGEPKIKSIADLVKNDKITYGTLQNGSTYNFFAVSQ